MSVVMRFKSAFSLSLLVVLLSAPSSSESQSDLDLDCQTVDDCVSEIGQLSYVKYGMTPEPTALAERIAAFGEPALVALVELLESPNPMTRKVAGYAIREIPVIDEKYLPKIKVGVERGVPWLVGALGNIHSDEAVELAVSLYLAADTSPHNQEAFAVKKHGIRAIPLLIAAAQCGDQCHGGRFYLLSHILGEMEASVASAAAEAIMEQAERTETQPENRANLIRLFSDLGPPGRLVEDRLLALRESYPELEYTIDQALIGVESSHAGRVYEEILQTRIDPLVMRDLSDLGAAGMDAGSVVLELLNEPDSDIRLSAVRTLGYIEYGPAVPHLLPLTMAGNDVRLNWAATVALGMIGVPAALNQLDKVASDHWYLGVREAAKNSIALIENEESYQSPHHEDNFADDFFSYRYMDVESCENVSLEKRDEDPSSKLDSRAPPGALEALAYEALVRPYLPGEEEGDRGAVPDGVVLVNDGDWTHLSDSSMQVPKVALKVAGGWLVGSNRGEWGGELVFINDDGEPSMVFDNNIEDIYRFGDRYIAVAGLAHMGSNGGAVYSLERISGQWQASLWQTLPGAPRSSWFVETGELLIDTYDGGTVLLSEEGTFRMAPCEGEESIGL